MQCAFHMLTTECEPTAIHVSEAVLIRQTTPHIDSCFQQVAVRYYVMLRLLIHLSLP